MKEKKPATSTINLRGIPESLHHTLRIQAAIEKTSLKDLIVKVLTEYLSRKSGFKIPDRKGE